MHKVDRVLGLLPHVPDDLADGEQAAVAAHCVHHIRTLLQLEPGLPSRRVYAVTSPSPGDGKTTLSIALGMSFAASGAKTLLLDCDIIGGGLSSKMDQMIRPKIGRVLRSEGLITDEQLQQALTTVKNTGRHVGDVLVDLGFVSEADVAHAAAVQAQSYVGLLDVLGGESLADCVTGTGRPGLFVLPIGSADAHHAAHLSPAALHRVLTEARAAFDVVLIDTGPILGSLEAAMVAAQADAVVLAVSRGVPQALVKRSLDRLLEVGANIAGMVLNRAASREVTDFAFSSASARSSNRRLPAPDAVPGDVQIRLGTVGQAMDSSTSKRRR
jgi:Mrp family chromosome partitioning ATPase